MLFQRLYWSAGRKYPQPYLLNGLPCHRRSSQSCRICLSQAHAVWALFPSCAAFKMICSVTFPGIEVSLTGLKLGLIQDLNLRLHLPYVRIIPLVQQAAMDALIVISNYFSHSLMLENRKKIKTETLIFRKNLQNSRKQSQTLFLLCCWDILNEENGQKDIHRVTKGIWIGEDLKDRTIVTFEYFFKFKATFKELMELLQS